MWKFYNFWILKDNKCILVYTHLLCIYYSMNCFDFFSQWTSSSSSHESHLHCLRIHAAHMGKIHQSLTNRTLGFYHMTFRLCHMTWGWPMKCLHCHFKFEEHVDMTVDYFKYLCYLLQLSCIFIDRIGIPWCRWTQYHYYIVVKHYSIVMDTFCRKW